MDFFKSLKRNITGSQGDAHSSTSRFWGGHASSSQHSSAPPEWTPAPEISHEDGKWNEASGEEYDKAESFCNKSRPQSPRLLPSVAVDRIEEIGCKAWGIEIPTNPRFAGHVKNDSEGGPVVVTQSTCEGVCLLSNLPIIAGLYDIQGKLGVYYEVCINRMDKPGIIAIGTAVRPYPDWRFPGWNRLSAGLHLDDFRKFFEDPDGGRDYTGDTCINPGDTIGCGYEFQSGTLFYTRNGDRLPPAFIGIYLPHHNHDVFAAIGVEGQCEFQVNFGGDKFEWEEGNKGAWRVADHVGRMAGAGVVADDELPSYEQLSEISIDIALFLSFGLD